MSLTKHLTKVVVVVNQVKMLSMSEREKLVETLLKRLFLGVLIVLLISVVVGLIFAPLSQPRIPYNHSRAIHSITDLSLAESNFAIRHPSTGFACNLGDLEQSSEPVPLAGSVDRVLASGTKAGYHFEILCPQGSQSVTGYAITAVPVSPGITGKYAFCADQSGQVWYSENGLALDCLAKHKPVERQRAYEAPDKKTLSDG